MVRSSLWPCSHDKPSWEPYRLGLLAPYKGIRNLESGIRQFYLVPVEYRILGLSIRNGGQGIRNPTKDWNPEFKFHWQRSGIQYLESGIHGVESRIQDCLGCPYVGWAFVHTWNTTVKSRLKATSVIRSPRYYGHFFWPPGKNRHTVSCIKNLVNTANFFGPLVTVLTGFLPIFCSTFVPELCKTTSYFKPDRLRTD